LKKGIQDVEFCFPATGAATSSPQKKIMNQITKYYIKRKLEKKVGQCGGIQGRQDHRERERVRQYCRREKKNATPRCFASLLHASSPCVSALQHSASVSSYSFHLISIGVELQEVMQ
jgi:hypothetical protein